MSEEILKALTQLFAIISKQDDGVTEEERNYVIRFFQQELDRDSIREYVEFFDEVSGYNRKEEHDGNRMTSVKDSVRTLGICRKINKTLTQKQKVIVLIRLLEMVGSEKTFTAQALAIIDTVATVFNINAHEYKLIETFVMATEAHSCDLPELRTIETVQPGTTADDHNHHKEGRLIFMAIHSVATYFVKYIGNESNSLNGYVMQPNRVYLFSHGSSVKTTSGDAIYYSDLVSSFNKDLRSIKLSFSADIGTYNFANGSTGLRNVVIAEGPGRLIGIMGASGAGKTTLLNVLAGLEKPTEGEIAINGIDIYKDKDKIHGVIGYVAQDDLLIEELTVYQNLYFNARLCFADATREEIHDRVMEVLTNLGLDQRKDLRVGNSLDKTISGGQRKRLNIALELIREPAILFLDEPTSGLSSRDSENVIDLLKELSLKGKLIFVVIHQPSSEIYKMFDKMVIMDTGGYPVYYGSPVEAITYFKKATHQVDSNRGQCEICGNVNSEQIFNIIEAKVVDEYGQSTTKRKITPPQWHDMYKQSFTTPKVEEVKELPDHALRIPAKLKQAWIFATRDLLAKVSNKQYLLINLLQAPLLAAILALVIRYKNSPDGTEYIYRYNDNIPAFILMSIVVCLFMGLTVSAEEIIRDRKILKRESFLNLSWNSYLVSKVAILFTLSAIQAALFVLIGHAILEIHGMFTTYWLILFTTSCFANVLGLNISSAFNSAVTVYIIIPLLLIPQMILSGTLFSFDKLNDYISTKGKTPLVSDLMASRWAYEALAVHMFSDNEYQRPFFQYEKEKSSADFKAATLTDELTSLLQFIEENKSAKDDSTINLVRHNAAVIAYALKDEDIAEQSDLEAQDFSTKAVSDFLGQYRQRYQNIYNENVALQETKMSYYNKHGWNADWHKDRYFNQSLSDLVRNVNGMNRLVEHEGALIQLIDPVFQTPKPTHLLDYRAPFFASEKAFLGARFGTFHFNALVIWVMTGVLYLALYNLLLQKLIKGIEAVATTSLKLPTRTTIQKKVK